MFLRVLGVGYASAPLEGSDLMHHEHPKDFYFINHDPNNEFGDGVEIYYDEDGLRYNPKRRIVENPELKVAFVGDSFVEASQVRWENSFVGLVEDSFQEKIAVKNFGVSSYSPVLSYMQWREFGKNYSPDYVFYFLFYNDPRDDEIYLRNGVYENDSLVAVKGPRKEVVAVMRRSYFIRFIRKLWLGWKYKNDLKKEAAESNGPLTFEKAELNPGVTKVSSLYLTKLRTEVEANGGKFVMAAVPSKYRHIYDQKATSEDFARKWEAWADSTRIPIIDLTTAFEEAWEKGDTLFFNRDMHFNLKGHDVVAQEIVKFLESELSMKKKAEAVE